MRQCIVLFFALWMWLTLTEAAPAASTDNRLIRRQDDPAAIPVPAVPALEPALVTPVPAEVLSENVIDSGDATACGKKVQSDKPSDPAGEFLKCFMPGGF